jgi:hypothetical protein
VPKKSESLATGAVPPQLAPEFIVVPSPAPFHVLSVANALDVPLASTMPANAAVIRRQTEVLVDRVFIVLSFSGMLVGAL